MIAPMSRRVFRSQYLQASLPIHQERRRQPCEGNKPASAGQPDAPEITTSHSFTYTDTLSSESEQGLLLAVREGQCFESSKDNGIYA